MMLSKDAAGGADSAACTRISEVAPILNRFPLVCEHQYDGHGAGALRNTAHMSARRHELCNAEEEKEEDKGRLTLATWLSF